MATHKLFLGIRYNLDSDITKVTPLPIFKAQTRVTKLDILDDAIQQLKSLYVECQKETGSVERVPAYGKSKKKGNS